ncbi:MAG: lysophospholipid acyltransferase family protein [Dehalococcoidia bacterium]
MTFSRRVVLIVFRPLLSILFSWRVLGKENVPMTGPVILASNHVHAADPFLLAFGLPRWIDFMAKEELFQSVFVRAILRWAGSFSIRREGEMRHTQGVLDQAIEALEKGSMLGIFPEGSRSRDGRLTKAKTGCAVLASQADVPILPVGITGTDKLGGISWLWKRPPIVVNIGRPFRVTPAQGRLGRAQRQCLTTQIMREIANLLRPEYRGAYGRDEDREG